MLLAYSQGWPRLFICLGSGAVLTVISYLIGGCFQERSFKQLQKFEAPTIWELARIEGYAKGAEFSAPIGSSEISFPMHAMVGSFDARPIKMKDLVADREAIVHALAEKMPGGNSDRGVSTAMMIQVFLADDVGAITPAFVVLKKGKEIILLRPDALTSASVDAEWQAALRVSYVVHLAKGAALEDVIKATAKWGDATASDGDRDEAVKHLQESFDSVEQAIGEAVMLGREGRDPMRNPEPTTPFPLPSQPQRKPPPSDKSLEQLSAGDAKNKNVVVREFAGKLLVSSPRKITSSLILRLNVLRMLEVLEHECRDLDVPRQNEIKGIMDNLETILTRLRFEEFRAETSSDDSDTLEKLVSEYDEQVRRGRRIILDVESKAHSKEFEHLERLQERTKNLVIGGVESDFRGLDIAKKQAIRDKLADEADFKLQPKEPHSPSLERNDGSALTTFSIVWFPPDDDSPFILEIAARTSANGDLSVSATFYVYQNKGRSTVRDCRDILVVSRWGGWQLCCPALRPASVRITERELAGRFFSNVKLLARGAGKDITLPSKEDQDVYERWLQRVLESRLGKPGVKLEEHLPMEEAVKLAQRWNGGDSWGWIQYFTVLCFWTACASLVMQCLRITYLKREGEKFTLATGLSEALAKTPEGMPIGSLLTLPIIVSRSTGSSADRQAAAAEALNRMASKMNEGHSLARVCNQLMPVLGFLGTVVGISTALIGAGRILSQSIHERQDVIQAMTLSLGTAFDTTYVALALGIPILIGIAAVAAYTSYVADWIRQTVYSEVI